FLKFTEWPADTISDEIMLCTSKTSAFEELDAISGKVAQSKPIRIKRISLNEPSDDCQLLFLPREDGSERIRQWLTLTKNKPILVVSNINEFLDIGGMIGLMNDGRNLNFEVDLARVRRANLKLSAQLLQIARDVRSR
ncbi:MAG: YfiR family protein, partial [Nitrosomonas sp.]|nr:YfiR family protein [Nitrosomonas sp.]